MIAALSWTGRGGASRAEGRDVPLNRAGQLRFVVGAEPYDLELPTQDARLLLTAGHHDRRSGLAYLLDQVGRPDGLVPLMQEQVHRVEQDDRRSTAPAEGCDGADEVIA